MYYISKVSISLYFVLWSARS